MSAWPFGQTSTYSSDSDINSILTNYFDILNKLKNNDNDSNNNNNDKITKNNDTEANYEYQNSPDLINNLDSSFIERILNQPDLLHELNRQNNTLLDFICFGYFFDNKKVKIPHLQYLIDELISLISTPTNQDNNDDNNNTNDTDNDHLKPNNLINEKINKANIIADILSLDIWIIMDELVKNETYLNQLWSLIHDPSFLNENSPIVSIFLKVIENLLFTKQKPFLNFILKQDNIVDLILSHINITPLIDLFLKIIGTDKADNSNGIIKFISSQDLINKCLNFLDNDKYPNDIQNCVGDFLKALISISANAPVDDISVGPNELTRKLASHDCIDKMIDIILTQGGFALNITVSVVIELIRKNNSDYDPINLLTMNLKDNYPNDRDPIYLGYLLFKFTQNLDRLVEIIVKFDKPSDIERLNQLNESFIPLGFERFKIVELIAELLHCSNMGLMNSKRAPRIARKRDDIRIKDSISISESMSSLKLYDEIGTDSDTKNKSYQINENNDSTSNDKKNYNIINNNTNENTNENYNNTNTNNKIMTNDITNGNVIDINNTNHNNDDDRKRNNMKNNIKSLETSTGNKSLNSFNDEKTLMNYSFFSDDEEDDEVDESFEIPYVNENQNLKLRTRPTIGDVFKITLVDNQILPILLNLFLEYPWNNFWHNVVFDIIQQIFNGRMDFSYNSFLVYSLFDTLKSYQYILEPNNMKFFNSTKGKEPVSFQITNDFILKGYRNSYRFYENNKMNLGYMGHVVLIAEEIVKFSKLYKVELISPDIFNILQEEDWKFYSEQVLNDTRLMYAKILGGGTYVDDGNGNIIPQFPDTTTSASQTFIDGTVSNGTYYQNSSMDLDSNPDDYTSNENGTTINGSGLVNVELLEEQLTTESDLHEKLREMIASRAQEEIDKRNKENGVIILGPPENSSA